MNTHEVLRACALSWSLVPAPSVLVGPLLAGRVIRCGGESH